MTTGTPKPACLVCGRTSDDVPLLRFEYRGEDRCICPQHLPMLIHSPARLADVLPGADRLGAADHDD
jgi:hypothetical protein